MDFTFIERPRSPQMTPIQEWGEQLDPLFGKKGHEIHPGHLIVEVEVNELLYNLERLKHEFHYIYLVDVLAVDGGNGSFEVLYMLMNLDLHHRITLKVQLCSDSSLLSISDMWSSSDWGEREIYDLFGILFGDRPLRRLLTHDEFVGHPLRKDYKEQSQKPARPQIVEEQLLVSNKEAYWYEVPVLHPGTYGQFKLHVLTDGEVVLDTDVQIGLAHRCFEKICEDLSYQQIIPYTARLNYLSAPMNCLAWCRTVEAMLGLTISDRSMAIRMIFFELARISDHLVNIAFLTHDFGAMINYGRLMQLREGISQLYASYAGSRVLPTICRIGGLVQDLSARWITDCMQLSHDILEELDYCDRTFTRNKILSERLIGLSAFSGKQAIEWGFSGPNLRACGINLDLRKVHPFYFYDQIEFDTPLGGNGDAFDRYLVRMEEMRQSLKIISQILDNLPTGDVYGEYNSSLRFEATEVGYHSEEEVKKHFNVLTQNLNLPESMLYLPVEAANGELGFMIVSNGSNKPERVKLRSPSFYHAQALREVLKGVDLEDVALAIGSLNIVASEMDR